MNEIQNPFTPEGFVSSMKSLPVRNRVFQHVRRNDPSDGEVIKYEVDCIQKKERYAIEVKLVPEEFIEQTAEEDIIPTPAKALFGLGTFIGVTSAPLMTLEITESENAKTRLNQETRSLTNKWRKKQRRSRSFFTPVGENGIGLGSITTIRELEDSNLASFLAKFVSEIPEARRFISQPVNSA